MGVNIGSSNTSMDLCSQHEGVLFWCGLKSRALVSKMYGIHKFSLSTFLGAKKNLCVEVSSSGVIGVRKWKLGLKNVTASWSRLRETTSTLGGVVG